MNDQAHRLREMMRQRRERAQVIAVTSGKGGVGKTGLSVNLSIALAEQGQRVALLDADLGLANVEVLMGVTSFFNLEHVIEGEKTLPEIMIQGPGGVRIVPGSSGLARIADLHQEGRERVLSGLRLLQDQMDFVIIDTMAGIGRNATAFAVAADEVLLVATPEPSSIVDAYAMLKTLVGLRGNVHVRLVVNQAVNQQQAQAVAVKLGRVALNYLGRPLPCAGWIPRDPHVSQAVMQSRPLLSVYPDAPASRKIRDLAAAFTTRVSEEPSAQTGGFFRRIAQSFGLAGNG